MSIIALRCKRHNRDQKLPFHLLQYALDSDGRKAIRTLTEERGEVARGPWQYTPRPFDVGLYCQHCLNEGNRQPLPIDPEDLPDLGLADRPIVFIAPEAFDPPYIVEALRNAHDKQIRHVETLPEVAAAHTDDALLDQLHPALGQAIRAEILGGRGKLFQFQNEAIEAALAGHDFIVTTPTASGKTLTYLTPILDTLLKNEGSTALYLSPLVALTGDQLDAITRLDRSKTDWASRGERFSIHRVCRTLDFHRDRLTVARYDGSVTTGDRQAIRKAKPQLLLTTPDMLHIAILSGAFSDSTWAYLFRGLRYVVIDELHTYRGVLGAAFANLIRRLRRICEAHGAQPQFLCASATITEPAVTVEKLTGRRPIVIDGSATGAPMRRRQFVLWSDPSDDDARALSTQAKDALLFLLRNRVRTIAFGRSISEINDIYRFARAELREAELPQIQISPFMRELKPDEKRRIVRELKDGRLHAVISTTALAMGIDIGNLSAAVIIGFPGSIAQLWQEAGRAGRAGEGLIILILDKDPLNQFFVAHPQVLFDLHAEPVYCNPDNPYVVRSHLLCAARELPLSDTEIHFFGPQAHALAEQLKDQQLLIPAADGAGWMLSPSGDTALGAVSFRNLSFAIDVLTEERREVIVQVDAARAQRALHKYAHYQLIDRYYEVTQFDVDFGKQRGQILVRELERPEYTTTADINASVQITHTGPQQTRSHCCVTFGNVVSRTDVTGYYKVPLFARNEPFAFQPLGRAAPPTLEYVTQAFWITFNERAFHSLLADELPAGLYSLAGALRLATAVEELCDPSDIEVVSELFHTDTGQPTIIIYDATPGGVGIAEAAFANVERIMRRGLSILEECPYCSNHPASRGCPHCVTARYGDENTINRHVAIAIGRAIAP